MLLPDFIVPREAQILKGFSVPLAISARAECQMLCLALQHRAHFVRMDHAIRLGSFVLLFFGVLEQQQTNPSALHQLVPFVLTERRRILVNSVLLDISAVAVRQISSHAALFLASTAMRGQAVRLANRAQKATRVQVLNIDNS